jgi:predicted DNA-binding protein (UPF0278 family)
MVRRDEGGIEDRQTVVQRQSLHILPAMRKNVERIEDDRRIQTGVLKEIEAWLSVLPDRHELAIDRRAGVKGLRERGTTKGKRLLRSLPFRENSRTPFSSQTAWAR